MDKIRKYLGFNNYQNLLGSIDWDIENKEKLFGVLNVHGILDNYSSQDMLTFLCGKDFVYSILDFKKQLKDSGKKGLVLDIDETLSLTSVYWFSIMLELFGNPENLTAEEMYKKYHLSNNVPYWKNNKDILDWIHKHREDNKLQTKLPLINGTNTCYLDIHNSVIPVVGYVTVRPDNVQDGTQIWLDSYNFPKSNIIFRPKELEHGLGNLWKACILDLLYPEVAGIVDDNPGLIKMLPKRYKGEVFLYSHTKCEYNHINIHFCKTVDSVKKHILEVFGK